LIYLAVGSKLLALAAAVTVITDGKKFLPVWSKAEHSVSDKRRLVWVGAT
jgi:hypothetical protein